jgi:hypothetical protein
VSDRDVYVSDANGSVLLARQVGWQLCQDGTLWGLEDPAHGGRCSGCAPVYVLDAAPIAEGAPTSEWAGRVGRKVIFTYLHGETAEGVVTSVNDKYVFVRFGSLAHGEACEPERLALSVEV